jgi:hypothetical protein
VVAKYVPTHTDKSAGKRTTLTRPHFELALPAGAARNEAVVVMLVMCHISGIEEAELAAGRKEAIVLGLVLCTVQ